MQKNLLETKQTESESLNTITTVPYRPRQTKLSDCILEELEDDFTSESHNINSTKQVHFTDSAEQNDTTTSSSSKTNLICLKLPIKMPNLLHRRKTNNKSQKESLSSIALIESTNQLPLSEETNTACKSTHNSNYTHRFRSVVVRLFRRHFNTPQETNHCCC